MPSWLWWWRVARRIWRNPTLGVASHREEERFLLRWELLEVPAPDKEPR